MNFGFKTENGYCPSCKAFGRIWYIQDRESGTNNYEYALFSKSADKPKEYKFKNKSEIVNFLNDWKTEKEYDELIIQCNIGYHTIMNFTEVALLEKKGVRFRFDKTNNTLTELEEPRQETGFMPYLECLTMAKDILQKIYGKQQITLEEWLKEVEFDG